MFSLPFAVFSPKDNEKMSQRERFGTLSSGMGIEFFNHTKKLLYHYLIPFSIQILPNDKI